jgi:hypothetical protein
MTSKWEEYTPPTKPKPYVRKARNHCQMTDCYAYIRYKCTPAIEGAASIYVCERHMPHWRDKNHKIESATKTP